MKTGRKTPSATPPRRGRPRLEEPLKPWIEYIKRLEQHRPLRYEGVASLHAALLRESPQAVQRDLQTFRKVLNGKRPARAGLGAALIRLFGIDDGSVVAEDFDGPPDALAAKLPVRTSSSFPDLLLRIADGTRIELVESSSARIKHFGNSRRAIEPVLRPGVSYDLQIVRPAKAEGVAGHLCLLGRGDEDSRWQFVSVVADTAVPPDNVFQWGRMTGIRLTPWAQPGRFLLCVIGSQRDFPPSLSSIYWREKARTQGDGFLRAVDVGTIEAIVVNSVEFGAWSATLNYRIGAA